VIPPRREDPDAIELAMAQAVVLARAGRHADAARTCADTLTEAPRGGAGWLLPAEPTLNPAARPEIWASTLAILRNRAT
jgi:hypothetical protein